MSIETQWLDFLFPKYWSKLQYPFSKNTLLFPNVNIDKKWRFSLYKCEILLSIHWEHWSNIIDNTDDNILIQTDTCNNY